MTEEQRRQAEHFAPELGNELLTQGTNDNQPESDAQNPSPYVSSIESPAEATFKAVAAGILFGILFGAANAYLDLRAGLTISTSIPVAVMTVALFRTLRASGVNSSILEANLSQTVGSASSSVASGVIFTLPALFLWGFNTTFVQITVLAMSGGLLGVMFMIPLRPYLIVGSTLAYRIPRAPPAPRCSRPVRPAVPGPVTCSSVWVSAPWSRG